MTVLVGIKAVLKWAVNLVMFFLWGTAFIMLPIPVVVIIMVSPLWAGLLYASFMGTEATLTTYVVGLLEGGAIIYWRRFLLEAANKTLSGVQNLFDRIFFALDQW